jgi:SAM-dependent MidA family methyltransferase
MVIEDRRSFFRLPRRTPASGAQFSGLIFQSSDKKEQKLATRTLTMTILEKMLIEKIRTEGPVTFEKFMEMALYEPKYGYYASDNAGIGREGDFFTSSHLHPAFGRSVGRQIREMWEFMGRPADFSVVEMGPGEGYLAKDVLGYLGEHECGSCVDYRIVERNPATKQRQRGLLADFSDKVSWFASLEEMEVFRGCLLSNELLDAFPVHVVQMEEELKEVYVTLINNDLGEEGGPLSTGEIARYFGEMNIRLPKGYRTEVNLGVRDWLRGVDSLLREGFILTIDYGYTSREYYSEDRDRGTLVCYYRHHLSEDPFCNIGQQDITAHVNFSSLKIWGEQLGLQTAGFTSQGAFLISLGIEGEIRSLDPHSRDFPFELARIKRLFLPQGLGESHMVMVQHKGSKMPTLSGFTLRNRIRYL